MGTNIQQNSKIADLLTMIEHSYNQVPEYKGDNIYLSKYIKLLKQVLQFNGVDHELLNSQLGSIINRLEIKDIIRIGKNDNPPYEDINYLAICFETIVWAAKSLPKQSTDSETSNTGEPKLNRYPQVGDDIKKEMGTDGKIPNPKSILQLPKIITPVPKIITPVPMKTKKVFISYNEADAEVAQALKKLLQSYGSFEVLDYKDDHEHDNIPDLEQNYVNRADFTLFLLSEAAAKSRNVAEERKMALIKEKSSGKHCFLLVLDEFYHDFNEGNLFDQHIVTLRKKMPPANSFQGELDKTETARIQAVIDVNNYIRDTIKRGDGIYYDMRNVQSALLSINRLFRRLLIPKQA